MEQESQFYNNAIFWIEVSRIRPNPYQPRREFDQTALQSLADSIRQYGVLQPLVVSRYELEKDDGGLATEYELIAGERRWRASRLAGLSRVPALIRAPEQSDKVKLELAIIENLQREDLNPIERAEAFQKLVDEFGFKHTEVAKKIGKSREYVSNSIRLLALPEEIKSAVIGGKITEGHARPLLMLGDRPDEQSVLFKEIHLKKLTVRESEDIARRIAHDKVRKQVHSDPKILGLEKELSEFLGTRVRIEQKAVGGKVTIDFFSDEDLETLLSVINGRKDHEDENIKEDGPVLSEISDPDSSQASPGQGLSEEKTDEASQATSQTGSSINTNSIEGQPNMERRALDDNSDVPVDVRENILEERKDELIENEKKPAVTEDDIDSADFSSVVESAGDDPKSSRQGQGDDQTSPKSSFGDKDDQAGDDDLYSIQNFSI